MWGTSLASIRETIIRTAKWHAKDIPDNVTAYLAAFVREQGSLIELLAPGQAHLFCNHIQFHSTYLRLTDLDWDTLDIVQIHPTLFKRMNLDREAGDNLGINHYSPIIQKRKIWASTRT